MLSSLRVAFVFVAILTLVVPVVVRFLLFFLFVVFFGNVSNEEVGSCLAIIGNLI
jgi:hypothetical protein